MAERRRSQLFVMEACMVPVYVVIAIPPTLAGIAVILAVIRADRKDLPAIVRALMRMGRRDDDENGDAPPSLPGP